MHHMGEYPAGTGCFANVSVNFLTDVIVMLTFIRTEVETYKMLDPGTRVRILKALCDIRVEV